MADRSKHPIVHFVGSIPLPDSETVFRTLSKATGPHLIRLPDGETGIRKFYNGPESFTPDNQCVLGEAPGVRAFFVGAGFNSVGIASAGGAGRALAEWIVEGEPTMDLVGVDIRRFASFHGNNRWLRDRVAEILGLHYAVPWPNRELETARPFRRSPLHHQPG